MKKQQISSPKKIFTLAGIIYLLFYFKKSDNCQSSSNCRQVSKWKEGCCSCVFRLLKKHLKIDTYIYIMFFIEVKTLSVCASTEVVKMCHWCQRFPEFLTTTTLCSTTGIKFVPLFPSGRCVSS